MLPVQNRIANQEVKKCIVSRRDSSAHIRFIGRRIAHEGLRLVHELFRQTDNHVANLMDEVQVGMQPDLIGTNQAKKINPNLFRQSL